MFNNVQSTHVVQFTTLKPGTASRSVSSLTTRHWLSVSAMAAICMSTCCMGSSSSPELCCKSSIFLGSRSRIGPERKAGLGADQSCTILGAGLAELDPEEQFTEHADACAKSCTFQPSRSSPLVDALAAIDEIAHGARIEQESPHSKVPSAAQPSRRIGISPSPAAPAVRLPK